jgi:ubiquitin-protein ligase
MSNSHTLDDWEDVKAPTELQLTEPTTTAPEPDVEGELLPPSLPPPLPREYPVQQIDVIVLDISGSMKSKSSIDIDQTREDCSKIVFHTFVDKMMALEMDHALALVAFGADVTLTQSATREYEKFHDELGRLDANQSRTRLYDAVKYAADVALFSRQQLSKTSAGVAPNVALRVFALTDGEDNASTIAPHDLAAFLFLKDIVLDVFPMACVNSTLRAVCAASGGRCVDVFSVPECVAMFEDEPLLHVRSRVDALKPVAVKSAEELSAFALTLPLPPTPPPTLRPGGTAQPQSQPSFAPSKTASQQVAQAQPTVSRGSEEQKMQTMGISGALLKRVMKELREMQEFQIPTRLCDADDLAWKVLLKGPAASVYEGGNFVLSVTFPRDYPFKPPRVVFLTPVFHCNVNSNGSICLDILKDNWSPALTIAKIVVSLSSMLVDPNANDPLDVVKAQMFRDNRAEYDRLAREFTATHAGDLAKVLADNNITNMV